MSYRQIEDFNLMYAVKQFPIMGQGFGSRFESVIPLPDISFTYELFDAIPHNTLLFLWCFAGPLALAGFFRFSFLVSLWVFAC